MTSINGKGVVNLNYRKAYSIMVGAASDAIDIVQQFRRKENVSLTADVQTALTLVEIHLAEALALCEEMYLQQDGACTDNATDDTTAPNKN